MIKRPRYFFNKDMKKTFLCGMTLKWLSEKLRISYSYLSSIMQGKNGIDNYLCCAIMKEIGYNANDIKKRKNEFFTLR